MVDDRPDSENVVHPRHEVRTGQTARLKILVSGRLPSSLAPLRDAQIDVLSASDCGDVLRQAALHHPDVVILDDASSGFAERLSDSYGVVILRDQELKGVALRAVLAIAEALSNPSASTAGELARASEP